MGRILQANCSKCGYRTKLFVGGGLRDCEVETALAAAPDNQAFAQALREGARFQISRDVSVCRRCRQLLSVPYVTYWPADGASRQIASACPVCGGLPTRLNGNTKNTLCPSCGQQMTLFPCGHWD